MSSAAPISIPSHIIDKNNTKIDLARTPGGTVFGTTPGGTRIQYDLSQIMNLRNSPLARAAISKLPSIPGITLGASASDQKENDVDATSHEVRKGTH